MFFHKSDGSITWGWDGWFRCFIDWKDASDGTTWIRPVIHFHKWK